MATGWIYIYEEEKDWKSLDSLRTRIKGLAAENGERISDWVVRYGDGRQKSGIGALIRKMSAGESLYVEEVARLGSSLSEVVEVLSSALKRRIMVYGVEDKFSFDSSIAPQAYITALSHVNEIYNNLLSSRTKAALRKRRNDGVTLGRPVGSRCKMDVLVQNKENIERAISKGATYTDICKRYKVSYSTIVRFRNEYLPSQRNRKAGDHRYVMPVANVIGTSPEAMVCGSPTDKELDG